MIISFEKSKLFSFPEELCEKGTISKIMFDHVNLDEHDEKIIYGHEITNEKQKAILEYLAGQGYKKNDNIHGFSFIDTDEPIEIMYIFFYDNESQDRSPVLVGICEETDHIEINDDYSGAEGMYCPEKINGKELFDIFSEFLFEEE